MNSSSSALSYMQDAGGDRSITLETHLHSVKVKKCSFMQGMWDVAITQLPKLQRCCDKDGSSQNLKKII